MAVVYRAEDKALRRHVAVKVLYPHLMKKPEFAARFFREARAAAQLDHPHILRVHDVGGDGSASDEPGYIVMELVKGISLKDYLDREGPPLAETVAMIGSVLAEALGVAHAAGVIHRDVKPANVMIAEGGRLVLCDFGVARLQDDEALVTQTGALLGTPAYMAPEQALGQKIDARTDLYSLGATLYQLATGVLPATGTAAAVIAAVLKGDLVAPGRRNPRIGRELERVILKLLASKRDERYATADEARAALAEIHQAAGFADRDAELARYFAEPGSWNSEALPKILDSCITRARAAAERREMARALALADRVLAFEPEHPDALAIAKASGSDGGRRLRRMGLVGAVTLCAAVAVAIFAVRRQGATSPEPPELAPAFVPSKGVDAAPLTPADAAPARDAKAPSPSRDAARRAATPPKPTADAAPLAVAVPVAPPDAAPAPSPPKPGLATLTLRVTPYCNGAIAGQAVKTFAKVQLEPGEYTLECNHNGKRSSHTITVKPGENRFEKSMLAASVSVTTTVAIRFAGKAYPAGARFTTEPGTWRVDVVGGESTSLNINRACTIKVTPELGCY
jgi:hypothetical protein